MIVGYVRNAGYSEYADRKFGILAPSNETLISVVSKGEIYSLAIQFGWGEPKRRKLQEILSKLPTADIRSTAIIERYAEIDAYSQGKHPTKSLQISARNLGKNDIWIAATASVLNAKLITIDRDFEHLNAVFLDVAYIDQGLTGSDA